MTDITISPASIEDCYFIAEGILSAVGVELSENLGSRIKQGRGSVMDLFADVASRENSQYSYRNTLIVKDNTGKRAGVVIAYDGAALHELRQAFVNEFNRRCGTNHKEGEWDNETSDDEIYIDTVSVSPEFRHQGIGTRLIQAIEERYKGIGKPLGLLCAHDNQEARKLYEKLGFRAVGTRKFAGEEMIHMQKNVKF